MSKEHNSKGGQTYEFDTDKTLDNSEFDETQEESNEFEKKGFETLLEKVVDAIAKEVDNKKDALYYENDVYIDPETGLCIGKGVDLEEEKDKTIGITQSFVKQLSDSELGDVESKTAIINNKLKLLKLNLIKHSSGESYGILNENLFMFNLHGKIEKDAKVFGLRKIECPSDLNNLNSPKKYNFIDLSNLLLHQDILINWFDELWDFKKLNSQIYIALARIGEEYKLITYDNSIGDLGDVKYKITNATDKDKKMFSQKMPKFIVEKPEMETASMRTKSLLDKDTPPPLPLPNGKTISDKDTPPPLPPSKGKTIKKPDNKKESQNLVNDVIEKLENYLFILELRLKKYNKNNDTIKLKIKTIIKSIKKIIGYIIKNKASYSKDDFNWEGFVNNQLDIISKQELKANLEHSLKLSIVELAKSVNLDKDFIKNIITKEDNIHEEYAKLNDDYIVCSSKKTSFLYILKINDKKPLKINNKIFYFKDIKSIELNLEDNINYYFITGTNGKGNILDLEEQKLSFEQEYNVHKPVLTFEGNFISKVDKADGKSNFYNYKEKKYLLDDFINTSANFKEGQSLLLIEDKLEKYILSIKGEKIKDIRLFLKTILENKENLKLSENIISKIDPRSKLDYRIKYLFYDILKKYPDEISSLLTTFVDIQDALFNKEIQKLNAAALKIFIWRKIKSTTLNFSKEDKNIIIEYIADNVYDKNQVNQKKNRFEISFYQLFHKEIKMNINIDIIDNLIKELYIALTNKNIKNKKKILEGIIKDRIIDNDLKNSLLKKIRLIFKLGKNLTINKNTKGGIDVIVNSIINDVKSAVSFKMKNAINLYKDNFLEFSEDQHYNIALDFYKSVIDNENQEDNLMYEKLEFAINSIDIALQNINNTEKKSNLSTRKTNLEIKMIDILEKQKDKSNLSFILVSDRLKKLKFLYKSVLAIKFDDIKLKKAKNKINFQYYRRHFLKLVLTTTFITSTYITLNSKSGEDFIETVKNEASDIIKDTKQEISKIKFDTESHYLGDIEYFFKTKFEDIKKLSKEQLRKYNIEAPSFLKQESIINGHDKTLLRLKNNK